MAKCVGIVFGSLWNHERLIDQIGIISITAHILGDFLYHFVASRLDELRVEDVLPFVRCLRLVLVFLFICIA